MESPQQASVHPRRNLPPGEVDCRWWKKGNCTRGSTCFFRHEPSQAGVDSPEGRAKAASKKLGEDEEKGGVDSSESDAQVTGIQCAICFEVPEKYGLLINCDHTFCLECIRSWRTSAKNTSQNNSHDSMPENNNTLKRTSKTCPMCRVQSDYVVPSTVFPTRPSPGSSPKEPSPPAENSKSAEKQPAKNPAKEEIINTYLSRLKNIPCRYFEQSVQRKRDGARNARLNCGFGNNCHYAHINPDTEEPYTFSPEELHTMKQGQARKRRARDRAVEREMEFIVRGLAPLSLDDMGSEFDDVDYYGLSAQGSEGDPDFEALSDFFGPSPFIYSMISSGLGPVFSPGETEWETETDDDDDGDGFV